MSAQAADTPHAPARSTAALGLAALGIVFGDIGTSPLYTLKTVLDYTGAASRRGGDARRAVA